MPHIRNIKKGFSLIELLIVMLIVVILAAMAVVTYSRFIERSRIGEAETIMGHGIYAQDRYRVRQGRYTPVWTYLDALPRSAKPGSNFLSEDATVYYTKGKEGPDVRNGFAVYFQSDGNNWFVTAKRIGSDTYTYSLVRPFLEKRVYCIPAEHNEEDHRICWDFMGLDEDTPIPADPRPRELQN